MSERKKAILKDAGSFSIATVLTQLINIVSAILMRRFLGPLQVGVWALVQVVLTYAEYTSLGVSSAITLEIPLCQGRGEHGRAESIKNTAFCFSAGTAVLVSLGVMGYALIARKNLSYDMFWGLLIVSGIVVLQRLNGLLVALLRAYKKFSLASRQMVYSALVNAFLVSILSFYFRLYGFMAAMALSFLFNILYILLAGGFRFRYSLDPKTVSSLVAFGFPIMLLLLFSTLFETIDKIMISRFLGLEQLGIYSIGLMASTYLYSIPNAVGIVMVPNIHEKYGRSGVKKDLADFLDKSDLVFSVLMPVFIGLAWFAVPAAVELFLPKFTAGTTSLQWLVLNIFFLSVSQAYSQCIYVFRQHKVFFPVFIFSSCVAAGLIWLFIRAGRGIEGVAIATTIAMAVHFHVIYFFTAPQVRRPTEVWKSYFFIMAKFVFLLAALLFILKFIVFKNLFLTVFARLAALILVYAPFLWVLNKKLGLFDAVFKKIRPAETAA